LVETGEAVSFHGKDHFPMQSVYKVPIAMAVLRDVESGRLHLDQRVRLDAADLLPPGPHSPIRDQHPTGVELSVRELLRFMIAQSDGTASDVLLAMVGGPDRANRYLEQVGLEGVVVAASERQMQKDSLAQYSSWATPNGAVKLLRALLDGRAVSPWSGALLLEWMAETPIGGLRLKGLLPEGTVVAHKTGTSKTVLGRTAATNDVGIVTLPDGRHLALAVFVADSTAEEAVRERVIAQVARAAWDRIVPPR